MVGSQKPNGFPPTKKHHKGLVGGPKFSPKETQGPNPKKEKKTNRHQPEKRNPKTSVFATKTPPKKKEKGGGPPFFFWGGGVGGKFG